ncbi:MAG: hypothetical protein SFZ03_00995 [Candidatus Melainabacteria bacterium]|nr:hypothetical protein [Candidatus Melainabacteria bacterium]
MTKDGKPIGHVSVTTATQPKKETFQVRGWLTLAANTASDRKLSPGFTEDAPKRGGLVQTMHNLGHLLTLISTSGASDKAIEILDLPFSEASRDLFHLAGQAKQQHRNTFLA